MHACIGEGNGNPLRYSCLENPRDGGAWWAAVYGVAQSRTRLKRFSSSSSGYGAFCFHIMLLKNVGVLPSRISTNEYWLEVCKIGRWSVFFIVVIEC